MTGSDRASAKSTAAPASIYWPGQQQRSCTSGAWAGRARLDSRADTGFYADPRNRHRTTHVYPLADLAYSMCFSEHHSQLFAHVRLNVFSDLGGAGVSVINGTVVKVRKGVGTYDEEELGARAAFQRGFLTALRRHPDLGATALYPLLVST